MKFDSTDLLFVSFREKYYQKIGIKQMTHIVVKDTLKKHFDQLPSKKINVKYVDPRTYSVFVLGDFKEVQTAIEILKSKDEIMAFEYMDPISR